MMKFFKILLMSLLMTVTLSYWIINRSMPIEKKYSYLCTCFAFIFVSYNILYGNNIRNLCTDICVEFQEKKLLGTLNFLGKEQTQKNSFTMNTINSKKFLKMMIPHLIIKTNLLSSVSISSHFVSFLLIFFSF